MKQSMKDRARKIALELLNLFFNNSVSFYVFRKLKLFDAVFVVYPADSSYADHFTSQWRQRKIKWSPFFIGLSRHSNSRKTSLNVAISATEDEIWNDGNADLLEGCFEEIVALRDKIGAKTEHFAGILPNRLERIGVVRSKNEQNATVEIVSASVLKLQSMYANLGNCEVILLGYKGFIGWEVFRRLQGLDVKVTGVDQGDVYIVPNGPHIVLNITRALAINNYTKYFGEGTVVLNEVYPPPNRSVRKHIKERGAKLLHIKGGNGNVLPPLPAMYHGAIPCCAAIPGEKYDPVLQEM